MSAGSSYGCYQPRRELWTGVKVIECSLMASRVSFHLISPPAMSTALSDFSTCEISDALIKLSVPHGGHIPDIHMVSPTSSNHFGIKICGPAYTVKMVLSSSTDAPSLSEHFVDTAPPGAVIVIDVPEGPLFLLLSVLPVYLEGQMPKMLSGEG